MAYTTVTYCTHHTTKLAVLKSMPVNATQYSLYQKPDEYDDESFISKRPLTDTIPPFLAPAHQRSRNFEITSCMLAAFHSPLQP